MKRVGKGVTCAPSVDVSQRLSTEEFSFKFRAMIGGSHVLVSDRSPPDTAMRKGFQNNQSHP